MDTRKVYVLRSLKEEAKNLGIDIFADAAALMLFCYESSDDGLCPVCQAGESIDDETRARAHQLMDEFCSTEGMGLLYLLGSALSVIGDNCLFDRSYRVPKNEVHDVSLSDFAMAAGMAILACSQYSNSRQIAAEKEKEIRRDIAYRAAIEKLKHDPKQREKTFVRGCWEKWQDEPGTYKSKAAFARDMLDKCEHLESTKKIEDWCREWEKQEPC